MIYKAEDKWTNDAPHLEHRSHKYYMKIGQGPTARYFYSAQEYAAYQNGSRRTGAPTQQIRREQQAATARNESRLIAKRNVRSNSKNSADVRNLKNTNAKAQRDANRAVDRLRQTQVRKEQQSANESNKREMASRRREARRQSYVDFQRNRGKEAPRQNTSRPSTDNAKIKRTEAHNNRVATAQTKRKAAYEKAHPIETGIKKARKAANSAYKSAKKAYNSKQAKAVRKKVKRTAQSAYKRGSSFVKKLFGR